MTINYSKQVLIKRGNTAASSSYTGPLGEITFDTDLNTIRAHDGTTAGGHILANVSQINSNINLSAVNANVAAANLTIALTNANIGAFQTYANIEFTDLWANAAAQTIALDNFIAGTGFATSANLGAYQIFANANIGAYQNYANVTFAELSANLGNIIVGTGFVTQTQLINNVNIISANVGSFQIFSNANATLQSQALFQANIDHAANTIAANALISALQTNAAIQQTQITALDANIGSIITGTGFASLDQLNANVGILNTKLRVNVEIISANLGAYQIFANANSIAQSNSIDVLLTNAATQATSINSLNANIGSYQTFANANVVAIMANLGVTQIWANANIATINSNLGAYQTYANASVVVIQANLGAYQTYANANAALQTNELNNLLANAGAQATSINLLTASVTAANSAITTLTANAATQAGLITTVNANVTAANAAITSLQSNAAVQQGVLDVLSGNAVTSTLELQQLTSNAAVQAANLVVLIANAATQGASLTVLVSNAAAQATALDNINSNIGAYQIFANANATIQANSITTIDANLGSLSLSIDNLTTNAATQGASLLSLDANLGTATTNITALQANAATQGNTLNNIGANVGAYQTYANANAATQSDSITTLIANTVTLTQSVDSLSANAATQGATLVTLDANLGTAATNITSLQSNAGSQAVSINSISANLGSYQTYANANAAAQATSLSSLIANTNVLTADINALYANAAQQQSDMANIVIGSGFALITQLTANVDTINANIGAYQTFANANAAGQTTEINSLRGNITAANAAITSLQSNAATQATEINSLRANITAANTLIPNLSAVSGNILPSANVTYSLGDATHQWKDLWVSNNTIYIGNTPIRVDGGTLLVNGTPVGGGATGNITFTNTTMSPPDGEDIIISAASSQVDIQALDFRVVTTDDVRITGNDVVSLRNLSTTEPVSIFTDYNGSAYGWEFGADGVLSVPGDIAVSGDVTGTVSASTLNLLAQPGSNTYIQLNNTVDSAFRAEANIALSTANNTHTWLFDNAGNLIFPDSTTQITAFSNTAVATYLSNFDGTINFTASPAIISGLGNISTARVWTGNLEFVDGSYQTTAFSNAAVVSYFSTAASGLTVAGNITQQSAYYETYANVTNSGGNLTCNFVNGATFYATLTANVTVNFANVVATAGQATGATIIVDQGATAYSVANIQINGGGVQTVKWAGGTTNTGTASNTDIMSFSLISLDGTSWRILGQIANYA
jgi:hypothetical protein